jgi:hypothetical protein
MYDIRWLEMVVVVVAATSGVHVRSSGVGDNEAKARESLDLRNPRWLELVVAVTTNGA